MKHLVALLAVFASNLGPCTSSPPQSEPRALPPPRATPPVVDVTEVDSPSHAATPQDNRHIARLWRGRDAVALIPPGANWLIVQRMTSNAFVQLDSITCQSTGPATDGTARSRCTFEAGTCHGTLAMSEQFAIGSGGGSLTVTIEPSDAGVCPQVAGEFDGRFGGPIAPSPPRVPNVACFLGRHVLSSDGRACSAAIANAIETFGGPCCIGAPVSRWIVAADTSKRWLASDGRTLVVAVQGETISPANIQSNSDLFQVYRAGVPRAARTLRVQDVFAGDPILQGTSSFSLNTAIVGDNLVVSSIGGASHAIPVAH